MNYNKLKYFKYFFVRIFLFLIENMYVILIRQCNNDINFSIQNKIFI